MGLLNVFACAAFSALIAVAPADDGKDAKKGKKGEKEEPEIHATIVDQQDTTTKIAGPACVYPKPGIFGEGEEEVAHIKVHHGKAVIDVKFENISTITVKKVEGEWVRVEIAYRSKKDPREFKVKNDCRFRGEASDLGGDYEIDLSEVKTITFEVVEKEPPEKKKEGA